MAAAKRQVELLEKNRPRQARAKKTYERIVTSAAELLIEVGVERISTNLIAERAGITVPALYRYFPNKYSVLNALGAVMMDKQNQVFDQWFLHYAKGSDPTQLLHNVYELLQDTYDVTKAQVGGLEIIHALRAVEPLQELRIASHVLVAEEFTKLASDISGLPVSKELNGVARLTIETGYAIVEMALEDSNLDSEQVLREGARMIALYWRDFLSGAEASDG